MPEAIHTIESLQKDIPYSDSRCVPQNQRRIPASGVGMSG